MKENYSDEIIEKSSEVLNFLYKNSSVEISDRELALNFFGLDPKDRGHGPMRIYDEVKRVCDLLCKHGLIEIFPGPDINKITEEGRNVVRSGGFLKFFKREKEKDRKEEVLLDNQSELTRIQLEQLRKDITTEAEEIRKKVAKELSDFHTSSTLRNTAHEKLIRRQDSIIYLTVGISIFLLVCNILALILNASYLSN